MEERGAYRRRQPEGTVLYEAVRESLATLLSETSDVGRGPSRYVEGDFARYLECGVLVHGFARVRCESCKGELLVAFSCKGRGVCPSCNAKRAQVTAVHLVERVLRHVPYRQWTLSFPHRVRWVLLKEKGLLSNVLTLFLRAVFALQRRNKQPRCSLLEGFSLHANTDLHANDRQGLEQRCRYRARGALALERLPRAEDSRIVYRMKLPQPEGTTHHLFTGLELLRCLAFLVPPPRANLTRFHGVFAPGAKLRPFQVPQSGGQEASAGLEAAARKERMGEHTASGLSQSCSGGRSTSRCSPA
ncbi:transposase [Myxococcus sp. AB056]|uniref:transposase n=1 Tax=Myxococcus sp. AB056 TaxID=2562792 RepID=UPI001890C308|nr:transposase [Myxococcus sp. AB056]